MSPFFRAIVFVVAGAVGPVWAADDTAVGTLGGFICVRPFSPACATRPETFKSPAAIGACQRDLEQFTAATYAYRDCMQAQLAQAIRAANEVIDRFRCLSQHVDCPEPAQRP